MKQIPHNKKKGKKIRILYNLQGVCQVSELSMKKEFICLKGLSVS